MTKGVHSFYIVTHSEGGAYGAGDEFSTPKGPLTYQIGYTGRLFGEWVTSNNRVAGNVNKWGLVYIHDYHAQDELFAIHGSTRSASIFLRLWDLKTVSLQQVLGSDGHIYWRQAPGSTPNGTQFAQVDGFVIHDYTQTLRSGWEAIKDFAR